MDCQVIRQVLPSVTVTIAPTIAPNPNAAMCPHARPDWRMCPHCLGINGNGGTR